MEPDFWYKRWELKEIGFHEPKANPLLVKWFHQLGLDEGQRIFLPLCGKTLDIGWLLSQGVSVVGSELSEIAVRELFDELGLNPTVTQAGEFKRYSANNLDVYVGDFFELSAEILGKFDAIYDRAALVALPKHMRQAYTEKLMQLSNRAPQLVICFEYDQTIMEGPPFSISDEELASYFSSFYQLQSLEKTDVVGGLKGVCPAQEQVWYLSPV